MCGIVGIVHTDRQRPVLPEQIGDMCRAVSHRGPDDQGVWLGEGAGLGHRRLAIIDLSPTGHQPMSNEDGSVWTILNGEIYNFQELREDLVRRGHTFRSRSDTEVIVHLYEDRGPAFVEALHGMFAIAVWDARRRRLVLARDRVGKKPIKYALTDDALYFASELKALRGAGVPLHVVPEDVDAYLTFGYVPSPRTGFRGIAKLPPAHRLVWENGRVTLDRYWSLDFRNKRDRAPEEWRSEVRAAVKRAVERRLISEVPLGAFLSGGVDSSIVVACMAQASSKPVETFSVGFESESYNELPYAREIAERFATNHHEFVLRPDSAALLPRLAAQFEEPYADASALPSFLLAEETRRFVTVALNGDGGDEGFAGYTRYARASALSSRLAWLRRLGIRPLLSAAASAANGQLPSPLASRLDGLVQLSDARLGMRYAWICRLFSEREKRAMTAPGFVTPAPLPTESFAALVDDPAGGAEALDRMLRADALQYLPDDLCVKMDIATMAHGLEARSPLLDHEVLELAASIPASTKAPPGALKHLLKESFRDMLPASVLSRRKKGFSLPLDEWFRGPLLAMTRDLLAAPGAGVHDYLRPDALRRLIDAHAKGTVSRGHQLWSLVTLELWHRKVVSPSRS
jgi:asparagine synthase (glutamine-hydrolysing)